MFSTIVSIFFRLFNFAIVVYLLCYIFKKYLLPSLSIQFSTYTSYLPILKNKLKKLSERVDKIDVETVQQEKLSQELLEKIKIWKKNNSEQEEGRLKEQELINKNIINRLETQERLITVNKIRAAVFPTIVATSKEQLLSKFENEENAFKFQNKIIESMKRSL